MEIRSPLSPGPSPSPGGFKHIFPPLASLLMALPCMALSAKPGDLDEDGVSTVLDMAKLAAHFRGPHPMSPRVALIADMNQDGSLNEADQEALADEFRRNLRDLKKDSSRVSQTSPVGTGPISTANTEPAHGSQTNPLLCY